MVSNFPVNLCKETMKLHQFLILFTVYNFLIAERKFSYLNEHEVQNIRKEEGKKLRPMFRLFS